MNPPARLVTLLLLLASSATARPSPVIRGHGDAGPKPTRLFTVAAYESPYPVGQGVTGIPLRAQGGAFFLNPSPTTAPPNTACDGVKPCPPGNATVLFVDGDGRAWLVSSRGPFLISPS